jgi:CheY-like chemotaxis protein
MDANEALAATLSDLRNGIIHRLLTASWSGMTAASGWNPNPEKDRRWSSPSPGDQPASADRVPILIVEDNRADVFLICDAIESAGIPADLHVVPNGEDAILFLDAADSDPSAPRPALVILDIKLPRKPGREVLQHLRNSSNYAATPVIVVTSSDSAGDREDMGRLGVREYFRKPSDYPTFMKLGGIVRGMLP